MASANEFHIKSYVATDAIAAYVLVKKDAATDNVVVAGAGEAAIGVTMTNAAAGTVVPVRLLNGYGTALIKAGAAVTKNAVVRGIASGKIDDATTGAVIGTADEAATADGDIIEVSLRGSAPVAMVASANQAVPTDLATTIAFCTSVRTALIDNGIIKGAA
jgi:hypothetical protein